jgi:hypothetical protein
MGTNFFNFCQQVTGQNNSFTSTGKFDDQLSDFCNT